MTKTKHEPNKINDDFSLIASAFRGELDEDQLAIANEGVKWLATLIRKNMDYGSSVFHPPVLKPTMDSGDSILVRASDKVKRIEQLTRSGQNHVGEALEDTIRDLGAYCLLWLANPHRQK
jgi:hypothetical protein